MIEPGRDWEIAELDLDPPRAGEVLLRMVAAGLCHSDHHVRTGDLPARYPIVGGHEGAGIVEQVGPGVERLAPGDCVVCSFIPSCGRCRYCSTGRQNLCDLGAYLMEGCLPDQTFRFHDGMTDFGGLCMLGTFSERAVISQYSCVKVPDHLPLTTAVLVGCGVPTGWGASVYTGEVSPGDTVVIYGIGGIGINAVQGAAHAGARHVVVVDPVEAKRVTALKFGATHQAATLEQAQQIVTELTRGAGADTSIVTTGVLETDVVSSAFNILGKGGILVAVSLSAPESLTVQVSGLALVTFQRQIRGSLFGSANPQYDILKMLELYQDGTLRLDELISARYHLEEINQGYADLIEGKNIRGTIVFD